MTMRIGRDKALAAKVRPSGAQPQQDRVLAGPPPRLRRPPGRPEAACLRGGLLDLRRRPTEVRSALLEGGNGG